MIEISEHFPLVASSGASALAAFYGAFRAMEIKLARIDAQIEIALERADAAHDRIDALMTMPRGPGHGIWKDRTPEGN